MSLPLLLNVKVIFPVGIDVPIACRPHMSQILLLHRVAFLLELLHHSGHVHRVPDNHRIGHQIGPAGAFAQKVTVSLWKKSVVLLHDMRGAKWLTFFHRYR